MNQPPPAEVVQPVPTPLSFSIGELTTPDGTHLVVLQLHLVTGIVVAFMPDDFAKAMANALLEHATGIVLPGLVVPA